MRSPHKRRYEGARQNCPEVGGVHHTVSSKYLNVDNKPITVHVHEVERSLFGIEPGTAVFTAFVHFATEWAQSGAKDRLVVNNTLIEDAAKRATAACKAAARDFMGIGHGLPLTYVTIISTYSDTGVEVELRLRPFEEL